jgi:hypothetical protein
MDCVSFSSFSALFYLSFFLGGGVGGLCSNFKVSTTCFKVFVYSRIGGGGSTFSYKLCLYHVVAVAGFACFFLCNLC